MTMTMNANASFASKFRFFPALFEKTSILNENLSPTRPKMMPQMKSDDKFFWHYRLNI